MSESAPSRLRSAWSRWLGVGLAGVLAIVTLGAAVTGALAQYVSPPMVWFAGIAAVVTLAGAIWSFALPLGAEAAATTDAAPQTALGRVVALVVGVIATLVALVVLLLPASSSDDASAPDAAKAGVADEL